MAVILLTGAELILFPCISKHHFLLPVFLHFISTTQSIKKPGFNPVWWFFRLPCSVLLWYWNLSWLKDSPRPSQPTALSSQKDLLSGRETRAQAHLLATFTYIKKWNANRFLCTSLFPAAESSTKPYWFSCLLWGIIYATISQQISALENIFSISFFSLLCHLTWK